MASKPLAFGNLHLLCGVILVYISLAVSLLASAVWHVSSLWRFDCKLQLRGCGLLGLHMDDISVSEAWLFCPFCIAFSYLLHGFWGWRVGDHSCFRRKLLARKLIWYYDDVNGDRRKQLKESSFGSLLVLLDTLKSAHKTIVSLEQTMQLVRDSMQEAQIVMALNMLRQWGDKEAALNEAIVKFLLVLCLEQSEQERKWLRSEIRRDNLNDPALLEVIQTHINEGWSEYYQAKRKAFDACQKGRHIWIQSAEDKDGAMRLGSDPEMKSMQLYVMKVDETLTEVDLDNADYQRNRQEFLANEWERHQPGKATFHALVSSREVVDLSFSPLPQCACELPRCCFPSICYFFPRCWQSLRCACQMPEERLSLRANYDNRKCSLVCCSVRLISQLQEQLLTTVGFAFAFCLFNLTTVVVGVLDGCQADVPVPCGLMLFQRSIGILCTCVFIAATIFCLQKENFENLEPLVTIFEMTAALQKLARQARIFKDGLGSTDELCLRIKASVETNRSAVSSLTAFTNAHGRQDEKAMAESVRAFLQ